MKIDELNFEQVFINNDTIELIDERPLKISISLFTDELEMINPNFIKIKFGTHDFSTISLNKDELTETFNNIMEYVKGSDKDHFDYERFISGSFDNDIGAILRINITRKELNRGRSSSYIYFDILIAVYPTYCDNPICYNNKNYIAVIE